MGIIPQALLLVNMLYTLLSSLEALLISPSLKPYSSIADPIKNPT